MPTAPRMTWLGHRAAACPLMIGILALAGLQADPAQAGCVKDVREVRIAEGTARVSSYLCQPEASATPSVRVGFYTLSEATAGALLDGQVWPELAQAFGQGRLVDNAIAREARDLFQRFGKHEVQETAFHFRALSPEDGPEVEKITGAHGQRRMSFLTFPDTEGLTGAPIWLPDADQEIKRTTGWGRDFKFFYRSFSECTAPDRFECTILWRYLNAEDIARFEERAKTMEQKLGIQIGGGEVVINGEVQPNVKMPTPGSETLALIQHLTRYRWPAEFITVVGQYSPCGGAVDFQYYPRQLTLDVAVIENVSSRPVSVGELLGAENPAPGLRRQFFAPATPPAASLTAVGAALGQLAPGERRIVPMRINFVTPKGQLDHFQGDGGERFYRLIAALPAGSVITERREGEAYEGAPPPLQKARESFLPPEVPSMAGLSYGPELHLYGLVVDGSRVALADTSANFIELTAGEGYGSCPFLYAWDADRKHWVNHGKVIDAADDRSRELTQEIAVAPGARRFRLREEELELAMIDRAALILELADARTVVLEAADPLLAGRDGLYRQILAGQAVDFDFKMSPTLSSIQVRAARLAITGYYRRYAGIEVSGLAPR